MAESITIIVNGATVSAEVGTTVAVALLNAGHSAFRTSARGEARGPLCGMGICHECEVTVDGVPHRRACLEPVSAWMEVHTERSGHG